MILQLIVDLHKKSFKFSVVVNLFWCFNERGQDRVATGTDIIPKYYDAAVLIYLFLQLTGFIYR